MCSAVMVAPDVLLTAAHCVAGSREFRVHFRDQAGEPVLSRRHLRRILIQRIHPNDLPSSAQ